MPDNHPNARARRNRKRKHQQEAWEREQERRRKYPPGLLIATPDGECASNLPDALHHYINGVCIILHDDDAQLAEPRIGGSRDFGAVDYSDIAEEFSNNDRNIWLWPDTDVGRQDVLTGKRRLIAAGVEAARVYVIAPSKVQQALMLETGGTAADIPQGQLRRLMETLPR